jgi:hypothetical protein
MPTAQPIMSGSPGAEPLSNPPQQGGFFSRIGAFLKTAAPYIQPIADRLAAAAGNYAPMELERQQREDALRQSQFQLQSQLQQSQLQNQDLQRQLTQKQLENYQTPAQVAQAQLDQQTKLHQMETDFTPPKDIVAPMDTGGMGHYSQTSRWNPNTQQMETNTVPTMVTRQVPNPTQAMVPSPPPSVGPPAPPMPTIPPPVGGEYLLKPPGTVPQQLQLPAMTKPQGSGMVVPDTNSPTGYSRELYDNFGTVISRIPNALPPYAQQGFESSNTTTETGPNGVNQINQTTSRRTPVGNSLPPSPLPPTRPSTPPNMNYKVGGPEAKQMMDQDVALNATANLINKVRSQAPLFASMLDAGKIQLGADPNSGFFGNIISRNLSPQEAQLAGNVQSLMEHINTMRTALQAQGFRGEEAWNALQAQRGNLMQHPEQIDTTLGNTLQVVQGLLANHQKLLNRPGATNGAAPSAKAAPRNADEYLRSIQQ